jgi:hypothetical protein
MDRQTLERIVCCLVFIASSLPAAEVGISVGRNIRVDRKETQEAEPYIAADPKHANCLILSALEAVDAFKSESLGAQSYYSNNGGLTWVPSALPALREGVLNGTLRAVLDDWVTFAPDGDAYYTAIPITSEGRYPIYVFRSTNEGHSWTDPTKIISARFDQPRAIASAGDGKVKIYIAATSGNPVLLLSEDEGKSFSTLARIQRTKAGHQQAVNPLVLVDGSLLLPYVGPGRGENQQLSCSRIYPVPHEDAGITIGPPQFVTGMARPDMADAFFATDLSHGSFRGRIYAAWEEGDYGPRLVKEGNHLVQRQTGTHRDVAVAHSTDNGKTWSAATILRAQDRGPSDLVSLAVSSDGALGVLWIQAERYRIRHHSYNVWFTASADGGETFPSPVRVSSETSRPDAKLNQRWYFAYRPYGGDYIGLAAAADGSFHAVWIDARDGIFRLYTARIEIRR